MAKIALPLFPVVNDIKIEETDRSMNEHSKLPANSEVWSIVSCQ